MMRPIDAHVHLGNLTKVYDLARLRRDLDEADCEGAVAFAFPEDMYRRADSREHRERANRYVLDCSKEDGTLAPFYFLWNDFVLPEGLEEYRGIKWHRHADEPRYDYSVPDCERAIGAVRELMLPVVVEEEFEHTRELVERLAPSPVIIPHMGGLNGGTEKMDVFFDDPRVAFDTAVAPVENVRWVLEHVGPRRVVFGSDVSGTAEPFFNFPRVELAKLRKLGLSGTDMQLVCRTNIRRLLARGKFHQLTMEWEAEEAPRSELPEGYSLRTSRPGDEAAEARLLDGAIGRWDEERAKKELFSRPEFYHANFFFVCRGEEPVGTAGLWKGTLHMVAVAEAHRGRRLSRLVCAAVMRRARELGLKRLTLTTDDFRIAAIRTYLKLGWKPVMLVNCEDHARRWEAVMKEIEA